MPELAEAGIAIIINVVCFDGKFTIVIVSIHNIARNLVTCAINKIKIF